MAKKLGYMQMRYVQDIYKRDMQKKINFEKDKTNFSMKLKKEKISKNGYRFFSIKWTCHSHNNKKNGVLLLGHSFRTTHL